MLEYKLVPLVDIDEGALNGLGEDGWEPLLQIGDSVAFRRLAPPPVTTEKLCFRCKHFGSTMIPPKDDDKDYTAQCHLHDLVTAATATCGDWKENE